MLSNLHEVLGFLFYYLILTKVSKEEIETERAGDGRARIHTSADFAGHALRHPPLQRAPPAKCEVSRSASQAGQWYRWRSH